MFIIYIQYIYIHIHFFFLHSFIDYPSLFHLDKEKVFQYGGKKIYTHHLSVKIHL